MPSSETAPIHDAPGRASGDVVNREHQRLVRSRRLRIGILQPQEAHDGPAHFRARRTDVGEGRAIRRLAQQDVLEERDRRRGRLRVGRRRRRHRGQLGLRFRRPPPRRLGERCDAGVERRLIAALRRDPHVLEACGQVVAPCDEPFEDALRLGVVIRSALALGLERERVGCLQIVRVQLQRAAPVADRFGEVSPPPFCERLQPLDLRAAGRQRGGAGQVLRPLLQLLLPQQQQPEICPSRRLLRHERDDPVELFPREHLLRRLHRGHANVERGDRVAVGLRRRFRFPFRRARPAERDDQQEGGDSDSSGHRGSVALSRGGSLQVSRRAHRGSPRPARRFH